ncbi:hypothetical protein NC652_008997 [Populus alba x Populus x berolinensis]|nr:hypothetical protein NC652_008997 [Populus alba x Populus x berolinensis]
MASGSASVPHHTEGHLSTGKTEGRTKKRRNKDGPYLFLYSKAN